MSAEKTVGYTYRKQFHLGIPDNQSDFLSWGGSMGLLYDEAKNLLFKTDFNKITVDVGTTVDRFLISRGVCREVTNIRHMQD